MYAKKRVKKKENSKREREKERKWKIIREKGREKREIEKKERCREKRHFLLLSIYKSPFCKQMKRIVAKGKATINHDDYYNPSSLPLYPAFHQFLGSEAPLCICWFTQSVSQSVFLAQYCILSLPLSLSRFLYFLFS